MTNPYLQRLEPGSPLYIWLNQLNDLQIEIDDLRNRECPSGSFRGFIPSPELQALMDTRAILAKEVPQEKIKFGQNTDQSDYTITPDHILTAG